MIAVTLGDPAGIGPEVVLKALADPAIAPLAAWTIVGDRDELARAGEACGIPLSSLRGVTVRHLDALRGRAGRPRPARRRLRPRRRRLRARSHRHVPAARGDRDGHRAGQQGGGRALRTAVLRPHRVHRGTLLRQRFPHDAHQSAPLRRPRHDAHAAARGGRRAAGTHHADDRPGRRGDALAGQRRRRASPSAA